MSAKRPSSLQVLKVHFPITAIVSILHRASGIALFLLLPCFFYGLELTLISAAKYAEWERLFALGWVRLLLFIFLSAGIYHLFAGIRHLTLDLGWGECLVAARVTAWSLLLFFSVAVAYLGSLLW